MDSLCRVLHSHYQRMWCGCNIPNIRFSCYFQECFVIYNNLISFYPQRIIQNGSTVAYFLLVVNSIFASFSLVFFLQWHNDGDSSLQPLPASLFTQSGGADILRVVHNCLQFSVPRQTNMAIFPTSKAKNAAAMEWTEWHIRQGTMICRPGAHHWIVFIYDDAINQRSMYSIRIYPWRGVFTPTSGTLPTPIKLYS